MFNRSREKESKYAKTPEDSIPKRKLNKVKTIFFIWNILSITLYVCYTFFVIYKTASKTFLSQVIIYLLMIYVAVFIILVIISLGNKKKLSYRLKNYKSATSFLKYAIKIINFTLSIITAISAFITTGVPNLGLVIYAVLSLFITFVSILVEIAKIIIRKNMPLIKHNFLEIRDKQHTTNKKESD